MSPRTAVLASTEAPTVTPDLAAVLQNARPHPQFGTPEPPPPNCAQLSRAATALAADLAADLARSPDAREHPAVPRTAHVMPPDTTLPSNTTLPPGTRACVYRTGTSGVLLLAPSDGPRALAVAGPGVYVVVESDG